MFGRSKSKPRNLPDLTPEMHHASGETIDWCLAQISAFVGEAVRPCPEFGSLHDERIGAYAAGFLTGYLQVTGADQRWARGDKGMMDLGALALCTAVLTAVLGPSRGVRVFGEIPLVRGPSAAPDLHQLYHAGGGDGIAHATGREKQFGGLLLHYLKHNIDRSAGIDPENTSATAFFDRSKTEEFRPSWRDGVDHAPAPSSVPIDTYKPRAPSLDDLGSRIEAARAKNSKRI